MIAKRINKFIDYQKVKVTYLEREIGASKGVLSRAIKNNTDIQSKWISKIVENYPQLSSLWLLTGEGEMLKQKQPKQEVSNIDYKEKYYKVLEEKDILSQQIITLQQQLLGNTS
ncbi:hypothetical protein, partial [Tenacibaculum finnmarkense]